ncbi:MAG: succinate dehydrogenase assembly factor 2 [Alphaproteobacteria bacterium]
MEATLPQTAPNTNHDLLLREVTYRCSYRSTLELDNVCRSLLPVLPTLETDELEAIRNLLLNTEGDLQSWLVEGKPVPDEWQLQVAMVRYWFKKKAP